MLYQLNRQLERIMPLITPLSVLIGVLLGSHLSGFTYLMPWIFAFMTFSGSISSNFSQFYRSITQPVPLMVTLFILHVIMPLLALSVGHLFYSGDHLTLTGLILAASIPTGITSFVWVSIYRGNIALTLSIILIDTLLSPFVVPLTLSLLVGAKVHMNISGMIAGLFLMIVLPSVLGMLLNQWSKGNVVTWSPRLAPFSKIGMGIVVAINGAVVAPYLRHLDAKIFELAVTVLGLAVCGYVMGWIAAKLMHWDRDILIALTFNGGMRNISAGAVLAVTYFTAPVAIPVVLGMLFQQTLASLFGYLVSKQSNAKENSAVNPRLIK
jgi:bile acid:Na+ symporter, BASS family